MREIYWGNAPVKHAGKGGQGGMIVREGELFYKVSDYDAMPPFFVAVVSGFDHWMFLSSKGGLTCGRKDPDSALFPYYTDDKIHDGSLTTGSKTLLLVDAGGRTCLWEPFAQGVTPYTLERNLYKNLAGNKLIYEEVNRDLGLAFSCRWSNGERFGFIKRSELRTLGSADCRIRVLDGLRNVLPYGVTRQTQEDRSTLLDAYKQAERVPGLAAGVFSASSILTDRAEPCEALKATVAWSTGLDDPDILLSEDQLPGFCAGASVRPEDTARGKRGAFFVHSGLSVTAGTARAWYIAADVNQGPVQLHGLLNEIREGVAPTDIEADIDAGTQRLAQLVGGADGFQLSSDVLVTARHFSNTLFNIMRGGTFYADYAFPSDDFLAFVGTWNAPLRDRFAGLLDGEPGPPTLQSVARAAELEGDADMQRLTLEYLPLIFSRRHGDPSRPWNRFSIDIRNADGSDKLHFQGNWRDIFQNWEALSLSYPEYIESFIAKFVNASTADGYNPYRITRDGIDWEVLEPENSWSNIGYWGDHQVNYLLKLIELSRRYHPGKLGRWLEREIFVYADVPYRIADYASLVRDPRNTVAYDHEHQEVIARRVEALGSDGKLHTLPDGSIHRVNLLEKLLLPVLSKLGNFVPGGGIWMNTQRPEWNDANNALVGYGLSMVTLCYLRRYLIELAAVLTEHGAEAYPVSAEVSELFSAIERVLQKNTALLGSDISPGQRKAVVDGLGLAGEAYRERVYRGYSGKRMSLEASDLQAFIALALQFIDHSLAGNRRNDGLFHSYNLIRFDKDGFEVEHLYEMLEGQVGVLSSGYLKPHESLALLQSLKESEIYRSDQNSYMLYPDRAQTHFLDRNVISPTALPDHAWIDGELDAGRTDLVERDVNGGIHFNGSFRSVADLRAALGRRPDIDPDDATSICELYEAIFNHRQFTGRSGSMFKYEGLGCIYWHMVSKLLLATGEVIAGVPADTDESTISGLIERFDDIKDGIGVHKTPAQYGAIPTDPYSHTPGFVGVQQPGMTGQVKEDFITRLAELGVVVQDGEMAFAPVMLKLDEFTSEGATWKYSVGDAMHSEELDPGSLAFTICGVPVIYRVAEKPGIRLWTADDATHDIAGNRLGQEWSRSLFLHDGQIRKIVVEIPRSALR